MYLFLKTIHATFAMLTITGFVLRSYWLFNGSNWLQHRATKIAPHVVDTLFLASGIALVFELNLVLFANGWLLAKFAGLIAYIVLGSIAMRFGRTPQVRMIAFVGAISMFAYIAGVALTKSPASWLAYS